MASEPLEQDIRDKRKSTTKWIYFAFSIAVTVGIFSYLFTFVSISDVVQLIRDADKRGILMFIILSIGMSLFRAWRYHLLLRLSGYAPGLFSLFLVALVGNSFSDLLPARLGMLVYVFIFTTRLGVPFAAAASSFAHVFLFDILALAPIVLIAAFATGANIQISPLVFVLSAVLISFVVGALIRALPQMFHFLAAVIHRFSLLSEAKRAKLEKGVLAIEQEIHETRKSGVYFRLLMLSVIARFAKYGALYLLLFGFLSPIGYGMADLDPARVFLGMVAAETAASLPISGVAGFGLYEGTWALVFELLGFPGDIAKLTSISHHLFVQVYGYILGVAAILILLLPIFKTKSSAVSEKFVLERALPYYLRLCIVIVGFISLAALAYRLPLAPSFGEESAASPITKEESLARSALAAKFKDRILFDSTRSGTFGIFSMKPDGSDVRVEIDTDLQEMYPEVSPDGRYIVFGQSRWRHRRAPSEVWIYDRVTEEKRKLADNGTFPVFTGDGKRVIFERERRKIISVDMPNGDNELELFPAGNKKFKGAEIVKPRVSPDGRFVAFIANKPKGWNSWYVDTENGEAFHISDGCEPTWMGNSEQIAWIRERDVLERSGIFLFNRKTGEKAVLHDADAPWGHEYFPTASKNGEFLLWSSCPVGQHSHIDSNYQIFLKDLNSGESARITFDGYTNRWPKPMPELDNR